MILITVLCRFSLLIVKYFLKHIEQRHSLCFDRAWLPLSNEWATAMSAKGWRYCLVVGKALAKSARCPQETLTLLFG